MTNKQHSSNKVALYTRVSTEGQTENFSLDSQMSLLEHYARDNKYEVYAKYIDGGFSGFYYARPEFQKMLNDAKEGKFNLILVYRLDRFFRSNKDLLNVVDELSKHDVGLKSITEPFDTTTSAGRLTLSLLGSMAEWERNSFVERARAGKLMRYKKGYYGGVSTSNYGYTYDLKTKEVKINEEEAEVVRLVYKLYVQQDSSLCKVARELRKIGCKTKKGKPFVSDRVHDILTAPIYMGTWYGNRLKGLNKQRDRAEWIPVKVPPIVSEDQYKYVQELLEKRRNYSKRNTATQYLLQHFIKCGDCSCTIGGTRDKQIIKKNGVVYGPYYKRYYRCTHFSKNIMDRNIECRLKYIQADILEKLVWDEIKQILVNPDLIKTIVDGQKKDEIKKLDVTRTTIESYNRKISNLGLEEQRVIGAYRKELITDEQLTQELEDIKSKRNLYTDNIKELKTNLSVQYTKEDIEGVMNYIAQISKGVDNFDFETKREVLKLFNTKIVVNIDGIVDVGLSLPVIKQKDSTTGIDIKQKKNSIGKTITNNMGSYFPCVASVACIFFLLVGCI